MDMGMDVDADVDIDINANFVSINQNSITVGPTLHETFNDGLSLANQITVDDQGRCPVRGSTTRCRLHKYLDSFVSLF